MNEPEELPGAGPRGPGGGKPPDTAGAGEVRFRLRLKPGREKSVLQRHPWIYTGAVDELEALEEAQPGDVGDIVDSRGRFLARGTIHPESQIVARVLAWETVPIDQAFFRARIELAAAGRGDWVETGGTDSWRVVNAEGDELPGLVVDRYGAVLIVQILTSGMLRLQPLWLPALVEVLRPTAVLERGEKARREHFPGQMHNLLWGELPPPRFEIRENGLAYWVDWLGGQKTGFYLDQRENRAAVRRLARDREVLNLFGYTGSFSVAARAGGARRVVQVESSPVARELARLNWERNGFEPDLLEISGEDVFQFLRKDGRNFDLLILDPPPLAKDRASLERALRAYKDLHIWSFCRARPGALIWTFSCSQHVSADLFQKVVFGAARDAGASIQWLGRLGPGPDHPVHLDHPQGEYLKGMWLRVLRPGHPPARREAAAPAERAEEDA
jgi:23S rRNA (cytosine1962-C5)-methyltransferase